MNDLVCPVCLTEGKSNDYPGEKLFCWNCMREGRGRVYVVHCPTPERRRELLAELTQMSQEMGLYEEKPEKPKKVRKSA